MATDIEVAKVCLSTLGGDASHAFETCVVDALTTPYGVRRVGALQVVGVPTLEQAERVVALLREIRGRGDARSHDAIVRACSEPGTDHEWQVLYRCRCCGFLVSELP